MCRWWRTAVLIETLDFPDKVSRCSNCKVIPSETTSRIMYDIGVYQNVESEENAKDFNNHFEQWKQSHEEWFQECTQNLMCEDSSARMARANGVKY